MLGIDERTLRVIWTAFLFTVLIALVWFIRETLVVFALAVFFAYMLSPIVDVVERLIPKRRNLALAAVYVVLVGLIILAGVELLPALAAEASNI